jgi:hypothetical protein
MEVTGLLAAAVAVGVFPGGLYLAAAASAAARGAGAWRWPALTPAEIAGLVALTLAAALVPLPGAPGRLIPDPGGAEANLLALLMLTGVALGLGSAPRWGAWRSAAAAAAGLPLLALAAAGSTLSAPTVAGLPGARLGVARLLAALALVLVGPALAGAGSADATERGGVERAVPAVGLTALFALLAVAIGFPSGWGRLPGFVAAALAVLVAGLVGLGLRPRVQPWAQRAGAAALLPALAAVGLALFGG